MKNQEKVHEFYDWDGRVHYMSIAQIRKHVPKRLVPYVDDILIDSDGAWLWLKDGAISTLSESHTIHFYTLKELDSELRTVKILNGNPIK